MDNCTPSTMMSPPKKRSSDLGHLSSNEKQCILNMYKQQLRDEPDKKINMVVFEISKTLASAMTACSAIGCNSTNAKGFIMVKFPRDETRRKLWAANTGRNNWTPTDQSLLCEVHFERDMWDRVRVGGQRKLKLNAVPTLFYNPTKKQPKVVKDPLDGAGSSGLQKIKLEDTLPVSQQYPLTCSGPKSVQKTRTADPLSEDDESSSSSTMSAVETRLMEAKSRILEGKRTHSSDDSPPKKLKTETREENTQPLKTAIIPKQRPDVKLDQKTETREENTQGLKIAVVRKQHPDVKLDQKSETSEENTQGLKIAVVPKQHPDVKLDEGQYKILRNDILKKILEESENCIKGPQFTGCHRELGAVVLSCANTYTRLWLESIVPTLEPWNGADLTTSDYERLLRRAKVRLTITGPMKKCSAVEVLEVLAHQNPDLGVEEWKVIERKVDERFTSLTVNIDERSLKMLHERSLKAFLGLGQVFFTVLARPVKI